jgi:subtilisin family serine protease
VDVFLDAFDEPRKYLWKSREGLCVCARDRTLGTMGRLGLLAAVVLVVAAPAAQGRAVAHPPPAVADVQLIVGFRAHTPAAVKAAAIRSANARVVRDFGPIQAELVVLPAADAASMRRALRAQASVRYVEPNAILHADDLVPNDPGFPKQWGLRNTGQVVGLSAGTPGADVHAASAWDVTTGSTPVTVGVIDTGVDLSHPDLSGNIWINPGENCPGCRNDGIDNDGNGYVDDWRGWNFVANTNNPADDNGHGTHVAGIAAASGNNGTGVAGVDWGARIMPLKFLDANGQGTTANAISALLYATRMGARITNNSYGGDTYSQAMADAIAYADGRGDLLVTAAGNSGADLDTAPSYPASYTLPNVLTVAATDNRDALASFSNVGAASVDLAAPGVDVYSTWPGGGYRYESGTSMAAPFVSGAAALVESADPNATGVGVRALLDGSADADPALAGVTATGGRLDVSSAVRCNDAPEVAIGSPRDGFTAAVGSAVPVEIIASACGHPAGVTVSAGDGSASIPLTPRGDGLYTGSYVPAAAGPVTITATATTGSATANASSAGDVPATIAPGGPAVTVTTTASGQNAELVFSGRAGERVSAALTGVSMGTSTCCGAVVSILAPDGSTVGSAKLVGTTGGFMDTRSLPADGLYTILVDPQGQATGSMTLTLYDVPDDAQTAVTPGGPAVTVTTTVPGQNGAATFTAAAGSRVSLKLSGSTIGSSSCCAALVTVRDPAGKAVSPSAYVGTSGAFVDAMTLTASGTYTIAVDPQGAATGSLTITAFDVPADAAAATTPGGPAATVANSVPGQNMRVSFPGSAGERISLRTSASSLSFVLMSVRTPGGGTVGSQAVFGTAGTFVDTQTLPASGTYTIVLDPQGAITGSVSVTIYDVPPDATATITPGGPGVSLQMPVPGQNGSATFAGQAGQRVSLRIAPSTVSFAQVKILRPDGGAVAGPVYAGTSGAFVDTVALPVSGTYTITVDPQQAYTGAVTLTLYDVPPNPTATAAVGGPAATVAMSVPGLNGTVTFAGSAGQTVMVKVGPTTVSQAQVSLLRPDGTVLVAPQYVFSSGKTFTATLPATGTYTVALDPSQAATGSMTVAVM